MSVGQVHAEFNEQRRFQAVMDERRHNCACPICGDSEYHAAGCEIGELEAKIVRLEATQIDPLAKVLLNEFGGPTQNESACEMAIRLLRKQRDEIDEARAWAGKFWCRILVEKEQNAAAIVWAYKSARGATREACALLCDKWAAFYKDRSDNLVHYTCRYLADAIRIGDGEILSTDKKG